MMTVPPWLNDAGNWLAAALIAWFGILARHAHWAALEAKTNPMVEIDWRAVAIDTLTAPLIGIAAFGVGRWAGAPDYALAAIIALAGLLGPAALRATLETLLANWASRP